MSTNVTVSLKIGQPCFVIWDDAIVEAVVSEIVISRSQTVRLLAELESREGPPDQDLSLVVRYKISPKSDDIYPGGREFACADDMTLLQQAVVDASMRRGDLARPAELLYPSAGQAARALIWHCEGKPFVSFSSFRDEDEPAGV